MRFDADTLMNAADMLGTVAFSISGAMTAIQRGLDLFGVFTLGIATALGGGIVRDIILGRCPPAAFVDWEYLVMAALAAWAATALDVEVLRKCFGAFLIAVGAMELFGKARE